MIEMEENEEFQKIFENLDIYGKALLFLLFANKEECPIEEKEDVEKSKNV
jgi:hypothetical protein